MSLEKYRKFRCGNQAMKPKKKTAEVCLGDSSSRNDHTEKVVRIEYEPQPEKKEVLYVPVYEPQPEKKAVTVVLEYKQQPEKELPVSIRPLPAFRPLNIQGFISLLCEVRNSLESIVSSDIPDEYAKAIGYAGMVGELEMKIRLAEDAIKGETLDPYNLLDQKLRTLEKRMEAIKAGVRSSGSTTKKSGKCVSGNTKKTRKPVADKPKKGRK